MRKIVFLLVVVISAITFSLSSCEQECRHTNMTESKVEATCTEHGETVYACDDCGYTYKDKIIEPKGHDFKKKTVSADCISDGYTEYTCECGFSYTSDYVSAVGHKYVDTVTPPSCTSNGYTTHKCQNCDYKYVSNQTTPTAHQYSKIITPPTCVEQGYTTYACEKCEHEYTSDYTAPTGHNLIDTVKPPTCIDEGYTTYSCEKCEYEYKSDHTSPTGHKLTKTVVTPTCTAQGYTLYSCESCEHEYKSDYTAPTDHEIVTTVTEPTCTEEGYTTFKCETCEYSYVSEQTKPTGHAFSKLTTMPTLSDMGYTEYECVNEDCGYKYTGDLRFYKDILPNGAYANNSTVVAKGIDVSEYNYGSFDSIDFESTKESGVDYVIIKAGSSYRDNFTLGGKEAKFEQSYNDAKAAGLDVGAYFYTYATNVNEIIQDARLLISILDGKQFEYPIYLDLEDPSLELIDKATITEMCVEFFTILQRAGYYTGLYVNDTWLQEHVQTDVALSKFEIWYARPNPEWDLEKFGEHLGMWQYSFEGAFEAMPDIPFDLNYAYKNYPEIIKENGFNGYTQDNINFIDSDKIFVYITANSLNVRSTPDFDSESNKLGTAYKGEYFEVLEKTDSYTKILFNGKVAYVTSNLSYISFEYPFK